MNIDTLRIIANDLTPRDVAQLSLAVNEPNLIIERKKQEYDRIFEKKMKQLWLGRMICYYTMWDCTHFWRSDRPDIFQPHHRFHKLQSSFYSIFRGWKSALCKNILYLSAKIFDDLIVLVIDLGFPGGSYRHGAPLKCSFDIVHSSHPIDIDSYAPIGTTSFIVKAMNDSYKSRLEQTGALSGQLRSATWNKNVSDDDILQTLKTSLGENWEFVPGSIQDTLKTNIDGVNIEITLDGRIAMSTRTGSLYRNDFLNRNYVSISWYSGYYNTSIHDLTRKVGKLALSMGVPSLTLEYVKKIDIKLNGKLDTFYTMRELRKMSKMSEAKLRSMAIRKNNNDLFIDFDAHTYRKKPISFNL